MMRQCNVSDTHSYSWEGSFLYWMMPWGFRWIAIESQIKSWVFRLLQNITEMDFRLLQVVTEIVYALRLFRIKCFHDKDEIMRLSQRLWDCLHAAALFTFLRVCVSKCLFLSSVCVSGPETLGKTHGLPCGCRATHAAQRDKKGQRCRGIK